MADEIINRVARSSLVTLDIEDFYPRGKRMLIDLSKWLYKGLVLREKAFRTYLKAHDWTPYESHFVALTCTTEAVIPNWAYLLVSVHLASRAKWVIQGDLDSLEHSLIQNAIAQLPVESYINKSVIIKGCSQRDIPLNAYLILAQKLIPVVRSVQYGEACSSVPLFKSKKRD